MGSCTHIVDDSQVLNEYEYDAWGNVISQKETVKNRFKFNGQQLDPITQQYYLRARFYNPVIARFTGEDTYRGDGLNLYVYCANNPVYYVDPSGNECDPVNKLLTEVRDKTLFRGDRSSVTPEKVFQEGFKPKGTHNDALLHTKSNTTAGNFVSTSSDKSIAIEFAGKNGYLYEIKTNNYVDINLTYGERAYFPEQMEFSIPGGIRPSEIVGAYKIKSGKIIGDFIKNPNFRGK